ncbi:MAG: hypothetical protein HYV63_30245 [Candidatus Schekmanbacteria bacterium]|nr:hypothetical protein [Candidatus Schekmanbacteria bacterium]
MDRAAASKAYLAITVTFIGIITSSCAPVALLVMNYGRKSRDPSEIYVDLNKLDLSQSIEMLLSMGIELQLDIYLYTCNYVHPPCMYKYSIASQGIVILDPIVDRIMRTDDEYAIEDLLRLVDILSMDFPEIADSREVADLIPKVCGMPDGSAKRRAAYYLLDIVTGMRWTVQPCYTPFDCAGDPTIYLCPKPASRPGPGRGS